MGTVVDQETGEITETPDEPTAEQEAPQEPEAPAEPDDEPLTEEQVAEANDEGDEPEPEPVQGISQKEIDARVSKLEKASAAYIKRVTDILGEDVTDFKPSPLSLPFLFGFVFDPANVPLDENVVNATKALIGDPVPPPYVQDKQSYTCPDCEGWGQVLTGSKVHPYNVTKCVACKGRGAVGARYDVLPQQMRGGPPLQSEANGFDEEPPQLEDSWGTPLGHPDYGKMPQYRAPGWSEALEAYKRGEPAPIVP